MVRRPKVRSRAYELWEEGGRPPSQDIEFWLEAERQIKEKTKSKTEATIRAQSRLQALPVPPRAREKRVRNERQRFELGGSDPNGFLAGPIRTVLVL